MCPPKHTLFPYTTLFRSREKRGNERMGQRLRRLPKYVHGYVDRHGKARHYLRQPGRRKVTLPGLPWSEEFLTAYQAALNSSLPVIIGAKRSIALSSLILSHALSVNLTMRPSLTPSGRNHAHRGNRAGGVGGSV